MKLNRALEIIKRGDFLYPTARRDLEERLEYCNEVMKDKKKIEYVLAKDKERRKSLTKRK